MNRIGPAALDLHLPPELASVDPAALRSRAVEHQTDAGAADAQAAALRTAVIRLVPAAWLGLGASSFATGALLQANSLAGVAAAGRDLATTLDALAGALEQARADASAAVRTGQQLDDEVATENAFWARRPEPERVDPDPARLETQAAAARSLQARLAAATDAARRAWAQASAAFDLVAYQMPALSAAMSGSADDGWRPSTNLSALPAVDWRRLVGLSPVCQGAGWAGAGVLVGPDGRHYPLVVPWIEDARGRWSADLAPAEQAVSTLGGADPGWHEIGVRFGIDSFGPPAGTATKAAIVTAGFLGNAPQMIGRLRPDLLPLLRWTTSGLPTLSPPTGKSAIPPPRGGGTAQIPRSALVQEDDRLGWTSDTSGASPNRAAHRGGSDVVASKATPFTPNLVGMADSGLAGLGTAGRLDDSRLVAYRATFEENADGRVRARVVTYRVRDGSNGPTVLSDDVSVTPEGRLGRAPVTYRTPATPQVATVD